MRRTLARGWLLALLWAGLCAQTPDLSLKPADFARGVSLIPKAEHGVYRTPVPPDVYLTAVSPILADLAVFNGRGERIPHALRPVPEEEYARSTTHALPVFPLTGMQAEPDTNLRVTVAVSLERGGAVIRVGDAPQTSAPEASPDALLIDATALAEIPTQLAFSWTSATQDLWTSLVVEASEDLLTWHPVGEGAVAEISRGGHVLRANEIAITPAETDRYYRVRAATGELPEVSGVSAEVERTERTKATTTLRREGSWLGAHSFLYDLGGHFPVQSLGLEFPDRNTLVEAEVFSTDHPDQSGTPRGDALFYRVDTEHMLQSPALELSTPARERYVRFDFDTRGGGIGTQRPVLEAEYHPDEVLWVARGEGPYTMAYGSATCVVDTPPVRSLLAPFGDGALGVASAGQPRDLAGDAALRAPEPVPAPVPWKRYILWLVLVLAAGGLLALSVRLAYTKSP